MAGDDRYLLADTAAILMDLAVLVKEEGILAMEEEAEQLMESENIKQLILLAVDGYDPEDIIEIGSNRYWTDEPQGIKAMNYYFYLRGIVGIQAAKYPRLELFRSLIPEQGQRFFQKKLALRKQKKELEAAEIFSRFPLIFENMELSGKLHELEQEIDTLDSVSMQRVLRESDSHRVVLCLCGLGKETRQKIFDNYSDRLARILQEEMVVLYEEINETEVLGSVVKMLDIIKRLRASEEKETEPYYVII